jgi:DNA-binding beta-propeller fold protein YncE
VALAGDGQLVLYTPDLAAADTLDVSSALLAGERLIDVVAGSDGASLRLVAAGDTAGSIVTVRRRDRRVLERSDLRGVPTAAALHPDGHTLLVAIAPRTTETQERSALLFYPLDGARSPTEAELCAGPSRAMAPFRALDRLYAACEGGEVAEVDLKLRARIRTVPLGGRCGPVGAGLSANGTLVYVLCRETGTLLYLDRARLTLFDSLPVGSAVSSLAMTPGRRRAVVTRPLANEVAILDLRRRSVAERIAFGAPTTSTVSGDGRWAYVVGGEGVLRIDLSRQRVLARPGPAAAAVLAVWPGHSSPIMRW